jgi:hypothetical protein
MAGVDDLIGALTERLRANLNHGAPRVTKPAKYVTGMNFRLWLQTFNAYCDASDIAEEDRRPHLVGLLDLATAYAAVDNLNLADDIEYDEFSDRLLERFGQHRTVQDYRRELDARDQQEKEAMEAYGDVLLELVRCAYPALDNEARTELAKDRFLKGVRVPETVRERLFLNQPEDLTAAIRSARQLDAALRAAQAVRASGHRARPAWNAMESEKSEAEEWRQLKRRVAELEQQLQAARENSAASAPPGQTTRPSARLATVRAGCWICGQPEHRMAQCPRRNSAFAQKGCCYACGQPGHLAATCPNSGNGTRGSQRGN